MDIYNAIMKAADKIERHPERFNFGAVGIPDCGTPGCALGWIGHFSGLDPKEDDFVVTATRILELPKESLRDVPGPDVHESYTFYNRMDSLCGAGRVWRLSAKICADTMRLYAAKYHAPAKVVQPPDWNAIASRQAVGEHERSQELA